jgi:hypothetical protein
MVAIGFDKSLVAAKLSLNFDPSNHLLEGVVFDELPILTCFRVHINYVDTSTKWNHITYEPASFLDRRWIIVN